ncbi:MAG: hypothetical protein ACYS4W_10815 [Planctomycetota bacterium]|jgi:hypothetical protein
MLIANLAVLLIVLACVAYQYLKGTLVKSFATIIIAVCGATVAFGYFELLANVFITRAGDSRFPALVPWAQPLSFALLFVLTFAILQTGLAQVLRKPIDLGPLPERFGRVICGIFLGLIICGLLLTALVMGPLPNQYPYPRFDPDRPDPERPARVLFSADGLATGIFSAVSGGCFSGRRSFSALHPDFVDQAFLNRLSAPDDIPIVTTSDAIELPRKQGQQKAAAAWPAPDSLKDSDDKPIPGKAGHTLTIVRVGIKKKVIRDAGRFTLAQLRLVCKPRQFAADPLTGKGRNVYPLGYIKAQNQLRMKKLNDTIEVSVADFEEKTTVRWIDFAFHVPNDYVPVLVQFKQNSVAAVPAMISADDAPPAVPFDPSSERKKSSKAKTRR